MAKKGAARSGIVVGRWKLGRRLGEGGQGSVWVARPSGERHGTPRALKICKSADEQARARFEREIEILRRLDGAHVPALVDASDGWQEVAAIEGEIAWYVGELFTSSLEDLPNVHRAPMLALEVFRGALAALAGLHGSGVIHRDVKPGNILTGGEPDRVVMTDLGIAYGRNVETERKMLTNTLETVGTPSFRAPEVLVGERGDERSDVYSLGRTLLWTLAGPLSLDGPARLPASERFSEGARQMLSGIIGRACEHSPEERFETVAEMNSALAEVVVDVQRKATAPAPTGSGFRGVSADASAAYAWALDVIEKDNRVAWRTYTKERRGAIAERLGETRSSLESQNGLPREQRGRSELLDQLLADVSPIVAPTIAATEHGREGAADLLRDIAAPRGWKRHGLTELVELPDSLAYVVHNVLGSFAAGAGGAASAMALLELSLPNLRQQDEARTLWRTAKVVGWPEIFLGKAQPAWSYLFDLAERQPWLREACGDVEAWRETLVAYWWGLSFRQFLDDLSDENFQNLDPSDVIFVGVPPVFLHAGREICAQAFRIAIPDAEAVAGLATAYGVPVENVRRLWPKWTKILVQIAAKNAPDGRYASTLDLFQPALP